MVKQENPDIINH